MPSDGPVPPACVGLFLCLATATGQVLADIRYSPVRLEHEPGTASRTSTHENDDAPVWRDDEVEIFIDPFWSQTEYFQCALTSAGALDDALHHLRPVQDPGGANPLDTKRQTDSDITWSSGLASNVRIDENAWTLETALPFSALDLRGAPAGHEPDFNVTSADWDTGEYTCLSPAGDWHDPTQFGLLSLRPSQVELNECVSARWVGARIDCGCNGGPWMAAIMPTGGSRP